MTHSARWPPWVVTAAVLLLGLITTASASLAADQSLDRDRHRRFDAAAERARGAIGERLELYRANLTHLRSWVMIDGDVSRAEFADLTAIGFEDDLYPGVQAISLSRRVPRAELDEFQAAVQAEVGDDARYPRFIVRPPTAEAESYVVTYLEPIDRNQAAFGFDLGSDPARRAAVEAARDRGDAVGTAPTRLVQETGDQQGFVLLSPVYDTTAVPATAPARRRHFIGVISVVFRFDDMFEGVLGPRPEAEAEMYDVGPTVEPARRRFDDSTLLLDTDPSTTVSSTGGATGLHRNLDLNIGDRRWRLVLTPAPGFATRGSTLVVVVALFGTLISVLLASVISSALRGRGRAERRALEMTADLRAEEERTASILLGAPDAMLVIDGSGEITRANLAAEALFGYAARDMEGHPVEMLLPRDLAEVHRAHRAAYLDAPRRREMGAELELLARRDDGTSFPVEVSLSPLVGPDGSLEVIAAVRDVSERRVVQAALQAAYDHERATAEQLRDADELKTRFLNTISHELRTPLTAIVGFTDLMLTAPLGEEQKADYLRRIERNAQSLGTLIGDVLAFARVDRHDLILDATPVDLASEAELIAQQLSPILHGHTVAIDAPNPVPAIVDRDALTRMVTNLLTNAARYAPASTTVTVIVEQRGDRAVLTVADEGPGIPEEERERVFERFFRGETALTSRTPGTGIGLAVVSDLATRSGGAVRVVPHDGAGARFEIDLPAASAR